MRRPEVGLKNTLNMLRDFVCIGYHEGQFYLLKISILVMCFDLYKPFPCVLDYLENVLEIDLVTIGFLCFSRQEEGTGAPNDSCW